MPKKTNSAEFKGLWISREILEAQDLNLIEKCFLAVIVSLSTNGQKCTASNAYFARLFGITKKRASVIMNDLSRKNKIGILIKRDRVSSEIEMRVCTPIGIGILEKEEEIKEFIEDYRYKLLIKVDENSLPESETKYFKIAISFHKLIRGNLLNHNLSTKHIDDAKYEAWTKPIKMLIEKDGKSEDDIREVWRVLESDSFYQQNVQKTEKLREKQKSTGQSWFDQMLYKSRNGNKKRNNRGLGSTSEHSQLEIKKIANRILQEQS